VAAGGSEALSSPQRRKGVLAGRARRWRSGQPLLAEGGSGEVSTRREGLRILLTSTRFVASLFWLTIVVAAMLFILPYSDRNASPVFYAFVTLSVLIYLGHRLFPFEGYHPLAFFALLMATDALIALMIYLGGGAASGLSLLYLVVIIFSSAYFDLPQTMLVTALSCGAYFAPLLYETVSFNSLKGMLMAVPIYFIVALCGHFVISKAREQERDKRLLTHLYDQVDSKRKELSAFYAMSLKLASTLDQAEIVDVLLTNVADLVPSDAIALYLLDGAGELRPEKARWLREPGALLKEGEEHNPLRVSASAILPVVLRSPDEDPRFQEFMESSGYTSMISVPLFASASVIGVLSCFSHREGAFDDDSARVLLTLSSEAALALEKAGLYRTTLEDKTKIETIIKSLTDGLMVIDRRGVLQLVNPHMANLLGLGEGETGMPLPEILERVGPRLEFKETTLQEALDKVLLGGEHVKHEVVIEGEPAAFFQVHWVPLRGSWGEVTGAVILFHDVTDFVELDRMKSGFISIVSHELKTPLTSIRGFVRLLEAERVGSINQKQRHYLEIVNRQTESLTQLINDLLDLSRIEAGIIQVRQDEVRLHEVVRNVVSQMDNLAQEKGVQVSADVSPQLPTVRGDAERLSQVFINLLHNAIKFTPPGGKVRVEARSLGDECLVEVSDTGIGIPAQELPKVFDKFYQVDSSTTRRESGTGLGLAICRELVTAHGGRIWAESVKGEGATLKFTLPHFRRPAGEAGGCTSPAQGMPA